MYLIRLGTQVAVANSQVVPICQVVIKAGFTVLSTANLFKSVHRAINLADGCQFAETYPACNLC